jgi:hypothetical protein
MKEYLNNSKEELEFADSYSIEPRINVIMKNKSSGKELCIRVCPYVRFKCFMELYEHKVVIQPNDTLRLKHKGKLLFVSGSGDKRLDQLGIENGTVLETSVEVSKDSPRARQFFPSQDKNKAKAGQLWNYGDMASFYDWFFNGVVHSLWEIHQERGCLPIFTFIRFFSHPERIAFFEPDVQCWVPETLFQVLYSQSLDCLERCPYQARTFILVAGKLSCYCGPFPIYVRY